MPVELKKFDLITPPDCYHYNKFVLFFLQNDMTLLKFNQILKFICECLNQSSYLIT